MFAELRTFRCLTHLTACRQIDEDEYWDSVAKYEPWALDDSDSKPADTMMAHMRQD